MLELAQYKVCLRGYAYQSVRVHPSNTRCMLTVETKSGHALSPLVHWHTGKLQYLAVQTITVFHDGHCLVCVMYSNHISAMQLQGQLPLWLQQRVLASKLRPLTIFY